MLRLSHAITVYSVLRTHKQMGRRPIPMLCTGGGELAGRDCRQARLQYCALCSSNPVVEACLVVTLRAGQMVCKWSCRILVHAPYLPTLADIRYEQELEPG